MDTATDAATAVAAPVASAAAPLTTAVGGAVGGVASAIPVSSTESHLHPHLQTDAPLDGVHVCCHTCHLVKSNIHDLFWDGWQGSEKLTDVDMNFVAVKSKGILVAMIGLCIVIAIGAVFYANAESLKWVDAVYFTVVRDAVYFTVYSTVYFTVVFFFW